jgi:sec-independent protein translocase protein TatC
MPDNKDGKTMSILAHLDELRKRLVYTVIALFIAFLICFQYWEYILRWMKVPLTLVLTVKTTYPYVFPTYLPSPTKLIAVAPGEVFWIALKIAFIASIFLSLPFILAQVWLFISPGLLPKERRWALPFVVSATFMFIVGALFCQYVVLPFAMRFLLTYGVEEVTPMITIKEYIDFCGKFLLSFGLVFELPLIITVLSRLGLVTPQFLAKNRKFAILIAFIAAAILTPTPDMFNQTLMAVPIILLYEVGILMARLTRRRKDKAAEAEADS